MMLFKSKKIQSELYRPGDTCWSIGNGRAHTHTVEDIKFTSFMQMVKIDGQWVGAKLVFHDYDEAIRASGRNPELRGAR